MSGVNDNNVEQESSPLNIDKDDFLAYVVNLVNDNPGCELSITITAGGMLITGSLISGKEYFEGVANVIKREDMPEDTLLNVLAHEMSRIAEELYSESYGSERTVYIHLKDARYVAGASMIPANGTYWRGRLCDISGFNIGIMSYKE